MELLLNLYNVLAFTLTLATPETNARSKNQVIQNKVLGCKSLMKAADTIRQAKINQLKTRKIE